MKKANDKKTTEPLDSTRTGERRRFLRLFGTAAALLPITAIIGCSDDTAAPPATPSQSDQADAPAEQRTQQTESMTQAGSEPNSEATAEPAADAMSDASSEAPTTESVQEAMPSEDQAAGGEMPRVSLDDPTAKALGYKHDAANVDPQKYPQRKPDQVCANCTLYQGNGGEEWAGCQLFPGKLVNANGWCSGYTPKPS